MNFLEAKTKMEFGLVVLGYGDKQYKLVTEQAWGNNYPECKTKPHLLDSISRVCGDCKIFYISDTRLETIEDEDMVPGLDVLTGFFRSGVFR